MSVLRLMLIINSLIAIIFISIPLQIIFNLVGFKFKKLYPLLFYKIIKLITGIQINYNRTNFNKKKKGVLYIANHVSWFDIICLGTILNARFVAKKEVSRMGIFGFLAKLSNTYFIDNSDKKKISEYNEEIKKKLVQGENFIIFPEGTTSDGNGIKSFKSSMLECVFSNDKNLCIQPISICYTKKNNLPMGLYMRRNIAWVGDTSMVSAMTNFLATGPITVDLVFHNLMAINYFKNRKDLANYCEVKILDGLNSKLKIS